MIAQSTGGSSGSCESPAASSAALSATTCATSLLDDLMRYIRMAAASPAKAHCNALNTYLKVGILHSIGACAIALAELWGRYGRLHILPQRMLSTPPRLHSPPVPS